MKLPIYENNIKNIKLRILKQEKDGQKDLEQLGKDYKELGDKYINYYRDLFIIHKEINNSHVSSSFSNYEKASDLFLKNKSDVDHIYSLMAWGNAYKESFLPSMKKNDFLEFYEKAKAKYKEGIDFAIVRKHTKEYHFLMLEQFNLEIRKKVWDSDYLRPKRMIFFHTLKSPNSRAALNGLYYYSFLKKLEIWEYSLGGVETFDEPQKYIRDRLDETSAVIFLLSEDYSIERDNVEFEIEEVCERVKLNDPMQIIVIDIGNQELIEKLSKEIKNCKTYKIIMRI